MAVRNPAPISSSFVFCQSARVFCALTYNMKWNSLLENFSCYRELFFCLWNCIIVGICADSSCSNCIDTPRIFLRGGRCGCVQTLRLYMVFVLFYRMCYENMSKSQSRHLVRLQGKIGDRGGTVIKVLCYKSEGRWFDPSLCQWIFY